VRSFVFSSAGCVDEPTRVRQNARAFWTRAARPAGVSIAVEAIRINPTLNNEGPVLNGPFVIAIYQGVKFSNSCCANLLNPAQTQIAKRRLVKALPWGQTSCRRWRSMPYMYYWEKSRCCWFVCI